MKLIYSKPERDERENFIQILVWLPTPDGRYPDEDMAIGVLYKEGQTKIWTNDSTIRNFLGFRSHIYETKLGEAKKRLQKAYERWRKRKGETYEAG